MAEERAAVDALNFVASHAEEWSKDFNTRKCIFIFVNLVSKLTLSLGHSCWN
jgi:hypothetical protein